MQCYQISHSDRCKPVKYAKLKAINFISDFLKYKNTTTKNSDFAYVDVFNDDKKKRYLRKNFGSVGRTN